MKTTRKPDAQQPVITKPVVVKKVTKKKVTKKKRTKNYLNNKDLLLQIELSHKIDKVTDELAKMFYMLVERYGSKARFAVTESFKDDMKAFALMTLIKVWRSFNAEKSQNPFAYFTQVTTHAFYQYQNQERKQKNIKNEMLIEVNKSPSYAYMVEYEESQRLEHDNYEATNVHGDVTETQIEPEIDS